MKFKYFLTLLFIILFINGCSKTTTDLTYTGTIEGNEIDISSELSGKVSKIFIEEGKNVKKGEQIAQIDTTNLSFKLQKANAQVSSSKANLQDISNGAEAEEIQKSRANLEATKALLDGAKNKYDYNLKNLNDLKTLYESGGTSQKSLEDAQSLVDSASSNYQNLQKQYKANKAALDLLSKGATKEKINMSKSQVEAANANTQSLAYQISKGIIVSPIDGTIQNINFDENELVPTSGNIATLIDLNNLYLKIYIPQKYLNKISLNEELKLTNDYLKNKNIKGKIVYISSIAEFTPKNVESKESKEEMVFEIKIKITKGFNYLKPGMLIDVNLEDKI